MGEAAVRPGGRRTTSSRPSARLLRSRRSAGSSDLSAAAVATASVTAAVASSVVSLRSRITAAAASDSCAGGGILVSNCPRRSSLPSDCRYATTDPGPDATSRASKRATHASYRSADTSSRRRVSCLTKLVGSASAAAYSASRCLACCLAGREVNHARMGRGTSFARGEEPEMLFADGGGGGTGVAVLVAVGIAVAAETV
mmetsp:Transcript_22625/g.56050  ORF Transcript_22625/g.56050 Transcript_22625/m.56050 type:complete len:200 (-) Transcript_22625:779-1378(-)